jgi:hypothetical protein
MSNIIDSMNRIILALSKSQHEQLKTEVKEVREFLAKRTTPTDRGKWWQDNEAKDEARRKLREAAGKRFGVLKVCNRSTEESRYFNSYVEASKFLNSTPAIVGHRLRRAVNGVATIKVDDDIYTIERVACVEN